MAIYVGVNAPFVPVKCADRRTERGLHRQKPIMTRPIYDETGANRRFKDTSVDLPCVSEGQTLVLLCVWDSCLWQTEAGSLLPLETTAFIKEFHLHVGVGVGPAGDTAATAGRVTPYMTKTDLETEGIISACGI